MLLLLKIRHTAAAASAPDICGRRVLHAQTAAVWKAIKHRESEISYLALSLNIVAEAKEVFFLSSALFFCVKHHTHSSTISHTRRTHFPAIVTWMHLTRFKFLLLFSLFRALCIHFTVLYFFLQSSRVFTLVECLPRSNSGNREVCAMELKANVKLKVKLCDVSHVIGWKVFHHGKSCNSHMTDEVVSIKLHFITLSCAVCARFVV